MRIQDVLRQLAVTLTAFAIVGASVNLQAQVTASQSTDATWEWVELVGNDLILRSDSDSESSNSVGSITMNPGVVGANSVSSNLIFEVDPSLGSFKSRAAFDIDASNAGTTNFASLTMNASSQLDFQDTIRLEPGFLGSLRIQVKTTGSMTQNGNMIHGGGNTFINTMTTYSSHSNSLSIDGESGSSMADINGSTGGFNPADINEFELVNEDYTLVINEDLEFNEFNLSFSMTDQMSFYADGLDLQGFTVDQENNFLNTVELFANVYDEDGNFVPDAAITSTAGFTYRNFTAVPEPTSFVLLFPMAAMFCLKRRR